MSGTRRAHHLDDLGTWGGPDSTKRARLVLCGARAVCAAGLYSADVVSKAYTARHYSRQPVLMRPTCLLGAPSVWEPYADLIFTQWAFKIV